MPFLRKEMQYNGQKKNGKENPTNNVLQTPQTMFYKPETRIKTEQHEHTKKTGMKSVKPLFI